MAGPNLYWPSVARYDALVRQARQPILLPCIFVMPAKHRLTSGQCALLPLADVAETARRTCQSHAVARPGKLLLFPRMTPQTRPRVRPLTVGGQQVRQFCCRRYLGYAPEIAKLCRAFCSPSKLASIASAYSNASGATVKPAVGTVASDFAGMIAASTGPDFGPRAKGRSYNNLRYRLRVRSGNRAGIAQGYRLRNRRGDRSGCLRCYRNGETGRYRSRSRTS